MTLSSSSATIVRSSGAPLFNVFGIAVTLMAGRAETAGACSVARIVCPPGAGAPLHRHVEGENFIVIRGELTALVAGTEHLLGPGDAVFIQPWETHTFRNAGAIDAEFLAVATPSGHEKFFAEADALAREGRFTPETAMAVCASNGIELVPPA